MPNKKQHKPLFEGYKLPVNRSKVVSYSTFFETPEFYIDKPFKCNFVLKKKYGLLNNKSGGMKKQKEI
jgi:hypothetical protein